MALPQLSYLQRMASHRREEAAALRAIEPASRGPVAADADAGTDARDIVACIKTGEMDRFLIRLPAGSGGRVSLDLRRRALAMLVQDAAMAVAEAAKIEAQILTKIGKNGPPALYLSQLAAVKAKKDQPAPIREALEYPQLLAKLVASPEQLEAYEFPRVAAEPTVLEVATEARCRGCSASFSPATYYQAAPSAASRCRYHPGRIQKTLGVRQYSCCHVSIDKNTGGCETRTWHVYEPPRGPVSHPPLPAAPAPTSFVVAAALDAEMFYTAAGYEVGRVTLVDFVTEHVLMDVLVAPQCPPVIDYNSTFSGLSAELFESGTLAVVSFAQVRALLAQFIDPSRTILIGHSLENDLRVLQVSPPCLGL